FKAFEHRLADDLTSDGLLDRRAQLTHRNIDELLELERHSAPAEGVEQLTGQSGLQLEHACSLQQRKAERFDFEPFGDLAPRRVLEAVEDLRPAFELRTDVLLEHRVLRRDSCGPGWPQIHSSSLWCRA